MKPSDYLFNEQLGDSKYTYPKNWSKTAQDWHDWSSVFFQTGEPASPEKPKKRQETAKEDYPVQSNIPCKRCLHKVKVKVNAKKKVVVHLSKKIVNSLGLTNNDIVLLEITKVKK